MPYFLPRDVRDLSAAIERLGLTPGLSIGGHGAVTKIDEFKADLAALE